MATSLTEERRRQSLIDQIPMAGRSGPAPTNPANSGIHGSEAGRQFFNTAMALPGVGGLAKVASTGGMISRAFNTTAGAANKMASGGAGLTSAAAVADEALPASPAPRSNSLVAAAGYAGDAGRGTINPPAVNPLAQPPRVAQVAQAPTSDIHFDPSTNTYSGQNVGADAQIVNGRNLGGTVSPQNMQAADQLAADQRLTSIGRIANSGNVPATPSSPLMARVTATHSGNDWTARENLRRAKMDAGSLIHQSHWAKKGSGQLAQKAYADMQAADAAAMTGGQTEADVEVMKQNAGITREGMQQAGANHRTGLTESGADRRDGRRSLVDMARLDMDRETQGYANRTAAQQEQLRSTLLDPNASAEQRALAQRSLAALAGKTAADRMQTVTLPDTTNDMGQVVRGGQALVRILEDGSVQQVPVGAQATQPPTNHVQALRNDPKLAAQFDAQYGPGASARYLGK